MCPLALKLGEKDSLGHSLGYPFFRVVQGPRDMWGTLREIPQPGNSLITRRLLDSRFHGFKMKTWGFPRCGSHLCLLFQPGVFLQVNAFPWWVQTLCASLDF